MDLFVALVVMALGIAVGAIGAAATLAVLVVRAATHPRLVESPPQHEYDQYPTQPMQGTGASSVTLGGAQDVTVASEQAEHPDRAKTRLRTRCALCEGVRAALRLTGRALAGK